MAQIWGVISIIQFSDGSVQADLCAQPHKKLKLPTIENNPLSL